MFLLNNSTTICVNKKNSKNVELLWNLSHVSRFHFMVIWLTNTNPNHICNCRKNRPCQVWL